MDFFGHPHILNRDKIQGNVLMSKNRGKGIKVALGRWTYENKKINKKILQLKSTVDDLNGLLKGIGGKK